MCVCVEGARALPRIAYILSPISFSFDFFYFHIFVFAGFLCQTAGPAEFTFLHAPQILWRCLHTAIRWYTSYLCDDQMPMMSVIIFIYLFIYFHSFEMFHKRFWCRSPLLLLPAIVILLQYFGGNLIVAFAMRYTYSYFRGLPYVTGSEKKKKIGFYYINFLPNSPHEEHKIQTITTIIKVKLEITKSPMLLHSDSNLLFLFCVFYYWQFFRCCCCYFRCSSCVWQNEKGGRKREKRLRSLHDRD